MIRKIILLVILVALGWKGYEKYGHDSAQIKASPEDAFSAETEL
jgi:hypothetical protein